MYFTILFGNVLFKFSIKNSFISVKSSLLYTQMYKITIIKYKKKMMQEQKQTVMRKFVASISNKVKIRVRGQRTDE